MCWLHLAFSSLICNVAFHLGLQYMLWSTYPGYAWVLWSLMHVLYSSQGYIHSVISSWLLERFYSPGAISIILCPNFQCPYCHLMLVLYTLHYFNIKSSSSIMVTICCYHLLVTELYEKYMRMFYLTFNLLKLMPYFIFTAC